MERPGVDDWADQDLLTKDEARERLIAEIGRTRARLDQLAVECAASEGELLLLTRRLAAMESVCREYEPQLEG